jgi:hypothetical protein
MITVKNNARYALVNLVSVLLLFPAFYIVTISVLKYFLGISEPFDSSAPFIERMGIKDPPRFWNISLALLVGPPLAFILSVFQLLHLEWKSTWERLDLNVVIFFKRFPLIVAATSVLVMALIFLYMLLENCNCH